MTSMRVITWKHEGFGGKLFHVARHGLKPHTIIGTHRHEFEECFWVEKGDGWHVTSAGEIPLQPGDALCIRATDEHGLRAGAKGLGVVNISFPCSFSKRLAACSSVPWPWKSGGTPRHQALPQAAIVRLNAWTAELIQPGVSNADLDAFLFDLARLVAPHAQPDLPPRLVTACLAFKDVRHLAGGTAALARLTGCGPAHLNRLCRHWHQCTASELVARLRLDWAARELRLTARPISDIAETCGMPHLGHFYRRFRTRFGTTPKAWRDAAWGLFAPT